MVDLDKISEGLKTIAKTAEGVFVEAFSKGTSKNTHSGSGSDETFASSSEESVSESVADKISGIAKDFDLQQVVGFVEAIVSDYIRKQQDFKKSVPVKVKTWPHFKGSLPKYESLGASGLDVRAQLSEPVVIQPNERVLIPTGLSMEVPLEYEIQARPRSGLSLKKGLSLANTPGTIDADYRGEIKMIMINLGTEPVTIEDQERVAQLVICPIIKAEFEVVDELSDTDRGEGGFGSTGSK